MNKQTLIQFLIPLFYAVVIVLIVFYAWNDQKTIREGGSSPLYRNLMQYPAYVRRGFDSAELKTVPVISDLQSADFKSGDFQSGGKWALFDSRPL